MENKLQKIAISSYMKKIYIVMSLLVISIIYFSFNFIFDAQIANAASQLIKGQNNSAVYFLYDGNRYTFPNEKVYFSWYSDFSQISIIADEELANLPLIGNVTYKPGVKMVKITTDPKVYAVSLYNTLRWITTEELALTYHGENWKNEIHDVSDAFFINYKIGAPITHIENYNPVGQGALNLTYTPITTNSLFTLSAPSPEPQPPTPQPEPEPELPQIGCNYNNPPCSIDSECVDNTCIKKEGCQYNNPPCGLGQLCQLNICIDNDPEPLHGSSEALSTLFSLNETGPYFSETSCVATTTFAIQMPNFFDNALQSTVDLSYGSLPIFIRRPDLEAETIQAAQSGLMTLKRSIPNLVQYFGAYPCNTLTVNAFWNAAYGSPGSITIGGANGGIDHFWLVNHELTHSYFYSGMFKSWFSEGAANVIPLINEWDQYQQGLISYQDAYSYFYPDILTSLADYLLRTELNEDSGVRQQMAEYGITEDTTLCSVEDHYINGSNVARNMFERIILKIGKKNYLSAMRTLYLKHRLTDEPLTYDDVYQTFLYFSPPLSEPDMQQYLKHKLCIE